MLHHPPMRKKMGTETGKRLISLLLAAAAMVSAQRVRPDYDPETKDGLLIQHIQQEQDPGEKFRFMEQFAAQYPSHPAIAWVYDQLQPAYFQSKEYDQAMRVGGLLLTIEPENLEAATTALRSAEAKHDPQQTVKWATRLAQVAGAFAARGGASASQAKQAQTYADSCTYAAAMQTVDPKARLAILQGLQQRNPDNAFARALPADFFHTYLQMGDETTTIEMAEKGLKSDPDNVDMLMAVADFHFHKDTVKDRQSVITSTARVIEVIDKARPASMSDDEWVKKKFKMLGMAYYMGGMSNSMNSSFAKADGLLRAALPYLKDNAAEEAATLYHLGMANYRLAESGGDRSRPVDALKFMRRCAAVKSPYQQQAQKNVDGIKAEYNLQ
jgi:tetratricopeptide (TPR) repeat protein